jgi:hypothetical protein
MWTSTRTVTYLQALALLLFVPGSVLLADTDPSELLPLPAQANCELRMLEPGQAGSIYLSTFAPTKQECLKLGDDKTRAEFKPLPARRVESPIGPKED